MSAYLKINKQNLSERQTKDPESLSGTSPYFRQMISQAPENLGLPSAEMQEIQEIPAISQQKQESLLGKGARGIVRTGEDIADVLRSPVGNVLSLIDRGTGKIAEKITGKKALPYSKTFLSNIFPTSEMLMERRPEYSKPQTSGEADVSQFVQQTGDLVNPLGVLGKAGVGTKSLDFVKQLGKRIGLASGLSATGEVAKGVSEKLGVSPETADQIKFGTILVGSLATQSGFNGAEKFKNGLYDQVRSLKPKDAIVDARPLLNRALNAKKQLEKGGKASTHTYSLDKTNELINSIRKGKGRIAVDELEEFSKKINTERGTLYSEYKGHKGGRKTLKKKIDETSALVKSGIEDYGKTNPKYYEAWKEANGVHAAIEESKKISRFLEKNVGSLAKTGAGAVLIEGFTHPGAILPTTAGAMGLIGGIKGIELTNRIVKNKKLREYYINILDGAAREDTAFISHNLSKMTKAIEDNPDLLNQ